MSQELRSRRSERGQVCLADDQKGLPRLFQAARRPASVQASSDLALMQEEQGSERRAGAHEMPGVSQYNLEEDHLPSWRS